MTELAVIETQSPSLDIGAWGEALVFAGRMSQAVSDTEFVPAPLRGRPEAVTALIMYGLEIGVTPMQALQGMHIVDGRPSPSSELMRALILRSGHTLAIVESTGTRCRAYGQRKGAPDSARLPVEWNIDMARAAGLLGRKAWQTYPRAMLVARATGDIARALFPDVIKGLGYVAEDEADAAVSAWGAPEPPLVEKPPRKALQRKRASKAAAPEPAPGLEDVPLPPAFMEGELAAARAAEDAAREPVAPPVAPEPAEPAARPQRRVIRRVSAEDVPLPIFQEPPAPVTLPQPEPERPAPEPPPKPAGSGPAPLGAAPAKALQAGLTRELGTVATREERHALIGAILGREILTSKELTRQEGLKVLEMLGRFESGTASFEPVFYESDNRTHFKIYDLTPEPPENG